MPQKAVVVQVEENNLKHKESYAIKIRNLVAERIQFAQEHLHFKWLDAI